MTSSLLYTAAQLGFKVDLLQFGMNVVMDTINLAGEIAASNSNKDDGDYVDLSEEATDVEV